MQVCKISMVGKDGQTHADEFEAASLFDAADQAIRGWSKFWWWNPTAQIEVTAGEHHWMVSVERVRQWRATNDQAG